MQQRYPLWLKQQPGKLLYLKPWYRAVWFQRKSSFSTDGCVFCVAAASECGILRRLISLTEAALFASTFRYPHQLLCQPSCLCACKFNLFLFQPRELHCYNKMKGGIILLWDLRGKWISQHRHLLFLSSPLLSAVSVYAVYVHPPQLFQVIKGKLPRLNLLRLQSAYSKAAHHSQHLVRRGTDSLVSVG